MTPVPFQLDWKHISDLPLADPGFRQPGRIDLLLGVDVFIDVLRHGRRSGPPESPTALETEFGWVLCGGVGVSSDPPVNVCHFPSQFRHVWTRHPSALLGDRESSPRSSNPLHGRANCCLPLRS